MEVAVPPWVIPRMPKTLLTRLKVDVAETTPALLVWRKPEPVPRVRAEVEAEVEKKLVAVKTLEDALPKVASLLKVLVAKELMPVNVLLSAR